MQTRNKVQRVIDRFNKMKSEKDPWIPLYSLIAEYISTRKYPFNMTGDFVSSGPFLLDKLFDRSAGNANRLMSSCMVGALWPNGAKSVQVGMPLELVGSPFDNFENSDWYEFATQKVVETMDNPRAGFLSALDEYMYEQGGFGISGIHTIEMEDPTTPVRFESVEVKRFCVDEGPDGFVDTLYMEKEYTIKQAVQEYGGENLSAQSQKKFNEGKGDEKIIIIHAIEPRIDRDPNKFGVQDMPIASIHIEKGANKVVRESGYVEMPIAISRFWKNAGEKQGRAPGMEALSDITEINALREASIIATEKHLDPPLVVLDDGALGNGVINTSAGAIINMSISGRLGSNQKPIEPLNTVGPLDTTYERIAILAQNIKECFFIDRLQDFNNENKMTLGEAQLRDGLRGQSLTSIYSRQLSEQFVPTITRVFNILLRRGLLGVLRNSREEAALLEQGVTPRYIPDDIAEMMLGGKDFYRLNFISPAARIMQAEEMTGITTTVQFMMALAPFKPTVMDNLNEDAAARRVRALSGAPLDLLYDSDTVARNRKAKEQQQAAAMQLEAQRSQSETARNMAQATQMAGQAGLAQEDAPTGVAA